MIWSGSGMRFRAVVFQNGITDGNALVANVSPRIIAGRRNQLRYRILRFVAKRAAQKFIGP
jgi:hypothetical protein